MIHIIRSKFEVDRTHGILTATGVNETFQTLEDTVRPYGMKIPDETAIPAGVYTLSERFSPAFDRSMLMLSNTLRGVPAVHNGSCPFTYIYIHGGSRPEHSSGCILMPGLDNGQIWALLRKEVGDILIITDDFEGLNNEHR